MSTPVQSLDRMFDIIELISTFPRGISLTDLSVQVNLHPSTTHRMLSALVSRGYAIKDPETGKYRLTMRMFEVGSRVVMGMNIVSAAKPFLQQLAELTGETVHLVVRDRDEIVYLYKDSGPRFSAKEASFVGLRSPMYCTGVGKSILAQLPEPEVREIWSRTSVTRFTQNTITNYSALSKELELIRQRHFAIDNEEHEKDVKCAAAAILDIAGRPVGAISITSSDRDIPMDYLEKLGRSVSVTAKNISVLLGAAE